MSREPSLPLPELAEPPSSPPPMPRQRRPLRPFRSKKRAWSSAMQDYSPSSDPPVFSSDDGPDASIENYTTPERKKRQYTGAWWAHDQQQEAGMSSTTFSRHDDSGIWLPSDSSDDSALEKLAAATLTSEPFGGRIPQREEVRFARRSGLPIEFAEARIQRCLEEGKEVVDLSQLGLVSIPDDTLEALHSLIKHPNVGSDVPSEEAYESFIPSLQLFLAGNLLRSLPRELWRLQNLTVLSLRNNKLAHLPSAIGDLCNLQELNLAGNRLRWLPWELLKLLRPPGNLRRLTVSPNRMVQCIDFQGSTVLGKTAAETQEKIDLWSAKDDEDSHELSRNSSALLLKLHKILLQKQLIADAEDSESSQNFHQTETGYAWKQDPVFIAATAVSKMRFDGSLVRGSPERPSATLPEKWSFPVPSVDHTPAMEFPGPTTRVPNLFELSLRSATSQLPADDVKDLLPADVPEHFFRSLDEAADVQRDGGRSCSVCSREYVTPRCEWIEYWHYDPQATVFSANQTFLPFLRRTCSEGCAASVISGETGLA